MMFDPPDYPYKDLTDTLKDNYCTDDDLFSINMHSSHDRVDNLPLHNDLVTIAEEMISNVENGLSYQSNESGKYFNVENTTYLNGDTSNRHNSQLMLEQSDNNILNHDPVLLDDITVNEFLLPLQTSTGQTKDSDTVGPDLLALYSCVICHEIFTSDADLLDHTILLHASINLDDQNSTVLLDGDKPTAVPSEENNNNVDFETDWLVCTTCERVLSTALEVEPTEQLCCTNMQGKGDVVTRRLNTMYACDSCNGLFADGEALDRHRQECCLTLVQDYYVDDMRQCKKDLVSLPWSEVCFTCELCRVQFASSELLSQHTATCQSSSSIPPSNGRRTTNYTNANKMWNCGSCNQLFVTARELYRHKRGEDRPPGAPVASYTCEECGKVLGSLCALHTHKKMHKTSKPGYSCRVCNRRFNQSGHLAIHMRMHTGERPYPCDLCPKAFKVKVERDDHRRTHTGERPFACAACPKTFTAAARLREHARIHTDQRPYRCDICGAAFRRPYARTVHTLIHTGEKPHECDVCGTAFRRSGDMWKHKRTLHGVQALSDAELKV